MAESIDIIRSVMEKKGYAFKTLAFQDGKKRFTQICTADGRARLTLASSNPLYPFATSSARLIARDKMTAYDFVAQNGVPVPQSAVVPPQSDLAKAEALLKANGTVIVKPVKGAGSIGLTLDITTREALVDALNTVWQNDVPAVAQRQFFGEEIRFAVINGKVTAALLRQKPCVVGDGVSTMEQLISSENELRQNITDTLVPYPQLTAELVGETTVNSHAIPADGVVTELNKSTMIRGGASVYNILDTIHPSYIAAAEQAAYGLGRGFIVVDMMIADYTVPAASDNHVFIEFNLAPALSLFYSCRDGRHVPIAEKHLVPILEKVIYGDDDE